MPSQKFTDSKNREWLIDLDMAAVDRVFKSTGFNVTKWFNPEEAKKLENDVTLHLQVVYELLLPQATAAKIDVEDFKSGLKSLDIMLDCNKAIFEALINFSPAASRDQIRELNQKSQEYQAAMLKGSADLIHQIDPQKKATEAIEKLRAAMLTEQTPTGSNSPGNAPVPLA